MVASLHQSEISSLPLLHRGKVRDMYAVDDAHLLIVTTDRLSAFDVVLPDPIPGKGTVLNKTTDFWMDRMGHVLPNHQAAITLEQALPSSEERDPLAEHALVVKRLKPLPIEAIVRGYIIGSGWKDYQRSGSVCGIELPKGLQQAQQLPEPLYTPSSKAAVGEHDENIRYEQTVELIGVELAEQVRDVSLQLYKEAAAYALERGIIIADTKFEFGVDDNDQLHLIDEVLTPDSSRFWDAETYEVGISPPSFDKQIVRDYLETLDWDKTAPGPTLPAAILERTASRYREVLERLSA